MALPAVAMALDMLEFVVVFFFVCFVLGKELLVHRRRNHGSNGGTCPRSKLIVMMLCTEFYHLEEGAHFASCMLYEYKGNAQ